MLYCKLTGMGTEAGRRASNPQHAILETPIRLQVAKTDFDSAMLRALCDAHARVKRLRTRDQ